MHLLSELEHQILRLQGDVGIFFSPCILCPVLFNVYTDELNYLQSRETQDVTLPIVALTILAMLMIWCYLHQPYQHCRSYKTFVIISTDLMILYITRLKLCV